MKLLCAHFGTCGGCSYQDVPHETYSGIKREQVIRALARHGFEDANVEIPAEVAPHTRRRASVAFAIRGGTPEIGFRAARSHDIVDLHECLVLTPRLVRSILSFRDFLPSLFAGDGQGEMHLTECDNGIDLTLSLTPKFKPTVLPALADWANRNGVIRIAVNDHVVLQFAEPVIRFDGVEIAFPSNSFLQPTREGEHFLQTAVSGALARATHVADLFAGCGTFTFAVARRARVHAVDSDKAAISALQAAARKSPGLKPVTGETRNLFRLPLQPAELARFDAVIFDPPRAGAEAQARAVAGSSVGRLVYVSCNPESFARDARILAAKGFSLGRVKPVDQFLWSSHIELVALLERR